MLSFVQVQQLMLCERGCESQQHAAAGGRLGRRLGVVVYRRS